MKDSPLEQFIKNGVSALEKALPKQKYLYFPLLYSTLFWVMRKPGEWKEKIFSWKIWANPGRIRIKPDEFILFFFDLHKDLSFQYMEELEKKDLRTLRKAFRYLYPVVGLSDPFLTALFHEELKDHDYARIVSEFPERVAKAVSEIESANSRSRLVLGLMATLDNLASLSAYLLKQSPSRMAISGLVKKYLEQNND